MKKSKKIAAQMVEKTDQQLLEMVGDPYGWYPETLNAAKAELKKRNVALPHDPVKASATPAPASLSITPNEISEKEISFKERILDLILSLVLFAVPIGAFIGIVADSHGYFGRPTFSPIFKGIFGNFAPVAMGFFLLALTGAFWRVAVGVFLHAFKKNKKKT